MNENYTVGDLVAEFLARVGVTTCFGIVSVHNVPMLDGIGRRNAIRYVMARNEMGGAHMADAYARVTGHLGVIFSSTGPGAANAVPGLAEATFAGSAVLHITGQTATKFADRDMGTVHDLPGQSADARRGLQGAVPYPLGWRGSGRADLRRRDRIDPALRPGDGGSADRPATRGLAASTSARHAGPAAPAAAAARRGAAERPPWRS